MIQSQNADLAQILKPSSYWPFSARLKSCADTKHFSKLARNRLTRKLVLQSSIAGSTRRERGSWLALEGLKNRGRRTLANPEEQASCHSIAVFFKTVRIKEKRAGNH